MKAKNRFCPRVHTLEDRVVLSFSFSKMIHSILPFIPDRTQVKTLPSAAALAAHQSELAVATAARQSHAAAALAARQSHVAAATAARQSHTPEAALLHPGGVYQARLAARAARLAELRK